VREIAAICDTTSRSRPGNVARVNSSRVSFPIAFLGAAALALTLGACGSDNNDAEASPATTEEVVEEIIEETPATDTAPAANTCPTAAPENAAADWTYSGATGAVAVTGPTDTTAPVVEVTAPFSVTETQVQTLVPGDGPVVGEEATVLVCYLGVNGRDGSIFDNSFERGRPVDFPLYGVIPGFQKAIAGQTVGSSVAVAMTPEDGYPQGQPAAGIQPGDTLVFAIKILSAVN